MDRRGHVFWHRPAGSLHLPLARAPRCRVGPWSARIILFVPMVDAAGVFGCFNHRPCAFPPAPAGTQAHTLPPLAGARCLAPLAAASQSTCRVARLPPPPPPPPFRPLRGHLSPPCCTTTTPPGARRVAVQPARRRSRRLRAGGGSTPAASLPGLATATRKRRHRRQLRRLRLGTADDDIITLVGAASL